MKSHRMSDAWSGLTNIIKKLTAKNYIYVNTAKLKFCYKDHSKFKTPSLLRPLVSISKCSLINETCSLLRPISTSTIGGLPSGASHVLLIQQDSHNGSVSEVGHYLHKSHDLNTFGRSILDKYIKYFLL